MLKRIEKHPILVILFVCLGIFFSNLDIIYVNIMEARNFVTAREMLENGRWLLTTMNDVPRYEKPPLPTWLTALSGMLFGIHNLIALRLPAALMTLILILTFYKLTLKMFQNKSFSLYASLILSSSFYIIFSGRNGQWDIFTHGFMVISIYFLIKMIQDPKKQWMYALGSAVFLGCSFLSKGPVSLYALWLPFIIAYLAVYRKNLHTRQILPFITFLVLGLCIGISWYLYVRIEDPKTFLEIAQEETGNWTSYNIRPFYYYWSFFTQSGIWTIPSFVALLYPYLKNKVSNKKGYAFSFIWTMAAVVLLSVIPEKKSRYLLPVLIPMAINTAFYIEYLIGSFKHLKKAEKWPVYFNFGLIALIGILFPVGGYIFLQDRLEGFYFQFVLCALLLFTTAVFMVIYLKKQELKKTFLLTIAFCWIILAVGFPLAKTLYTNPEFNNISSLENNIAVYSFGEIAPESVWHLGRSAPDIWHNRNLQIPKEKKFGILTTTENTIKFKRIFAKEYHIKHADTFDINYTASPGQSSHKDRLMSYYFILEKKTQ